MRVTTKGQVTIPQPIREKLGIGPSTEIDFVEYKGRVYIVKKRSGSQRNAFRKVRGTASVKMRTEEIMRLTRLRRAFGEQGIPQAQKRKKEGV